VTTDVDPQFENLLEFVRDARGFDWSGYRRPSLMRRFEKRLLAVGAPDFQAYHIYLAEHPDEFMELFNTILINVTGFFRDRETWDLVAEKVIPELVGRAGAEGPIRVWSAGCASGEEPYTVAMLLCEALGEEAFRERVKIYATDIDDEALAEAREATYTRHQLSAVPGELVERYFTQSNSSFAFRGDLRRIVIFGRNDLHQDPPISRVDLLVSRNTLMYFSPPVQERILANFYFALSRGGYLVVGKAEALQSRTKLFVPFDLKRRIFVKDGSLEPTLQPMRARAREPLRIEGLPLGDTAFEHAPIAQLVVSPDNNVAALNHAARSMFGLKSKDIGRPLQDLEISYKPLDLRSLIDEVRKGRRLVSTKDVTWNEENGEKRRLDVQVAPLSDRDGGILGISVAFVDVTGHHQLQEGLERATRELETAYEELQSTVEELETTNEELQSTNEELETTNEELQSSNEELETMNEELQSTNEELETMNDELRDRTDEALRANSFLASVLASIHQSVVVVDGQLRVTGWSRAAFELWGVREDEVSGEHFLNLDIGIPVGDLRDPIRAVLAGAAGEQVVLDGHDRRGRPVRCTVSLGPLYGADDDLLGAIMVMSAEPRDA
jgi:two-component system, chemotaxis family, CheB/CheR fusion protein